MKSKPVPFWYLRKHARRLFRGRVSRVELSEESLKALKAMKANGERWHD